MHSIIQTEREAIRQASGKGKLNCGNKEKERAEKCDAFQDFMRCNTEAAIKSLEETLKMPPNFHIFGTITW